MADRRKLAQGLMMMTPAMREDLAGREQDIQRGKTVELLRRAGKEMYDNPIVNTAIGFTPVLGDIQAAGETMAALQRGAPLQETAGYAVGMLPFVPALRTTWHGSPHGFTKFDMSKIGTGEGAQAYGHGLYLAEAPEVAGSYRTAGDMGWFEREADKALYSQDIDTAIASTKKELERVSKEPRYVDAKNNLTGVLNVLEARKSGANEYGYLYKVDLPDEQIAKMLDYDLPLAQQPESVKQSLLQLNDPHINEALSTSPVYNEGGDYWSYMGNTYGSKNEALRDVTPSQLISGQRGGFKSPQEASQRLYEAGITGIQYLDQASRGAGEGTRNYVVFSDEIPQILERNGTPLGNAVRNFEAPKQQFYHGSTTQGITELDPSKSFGDLGVSWVTPSEDFAKRYARKEGAIYNVDLNEGKNFDFSNPEHLQALREQAKNVEYYDPLRGFQTLDMRVPEAGSYYAAEDPKLFNLIKDMGYDTVAVTEDGVRNIGVFNPKANARIVE